MLVYSETSKTKSGELRITRPIGALLIQTDETIENLTNETITVFIEKANGTNKNIAVNIPLRDFILASVFGENAYDGLSGVSALCEIANGGAIELGQNESIKVKLDNLKSAKTYTVYGIEMPVSSDELVNFDRKTVLTDEVSRSFDVAGADEVIITGSDVISEIHFSYMNGNTVKYLLEELKAMSKDIDPIIGVNPTGLVVSELSNILALPLVGVSKIEVYKTSGTVTLTTRDVNN